MKINELTENLNGAEGVYIIGSIKVDVAKNGSPYVRGTLSDVTGSLPFTFFDGDYGLEPGLNGEVVRVTGFSTDLYNGSLQIKKGSRGFRIEVLDEVDEELKAQLVPGFDEDISAGVSAMERAIASIGDPDYAAIVSHIWSSVREDFVNAPAAMHHHHSEVHGLLHHTREMLNLASPIEKLYGENLNIDLLRAGIVLHDVGKLQEFCFSSLGLVSDYSVEGNLLGHLVIGAREVEDAAQVCGVPREKAMLLENLLLSHHGTREFGAAVKPGTLESVALFFLDYASSHLREYSDILSATEPGTMTEYIRDIDGRLYRHKT